MAHRPSKRPRVGGSYHDPVPLTTGFSTVHAREGSLRRVGNELLTTPSEWFPQQEVDHAWNSATSWLPVDDLHFALDPNGEWYDEVVDRDVMQDHITVDGPALATRPKTRVRSKVSVSQDSFAMSLQFDPPLAKASCCVERHPSPNIPRRNDTMGGKRGFYGCI